MQRFGQCRSPTGRVLTVVLHELLQGGGLALFGTGDEYDGVREWWNQDGRGYLRPQEHLTELLVDASGDSLRFTDRPNLRYARYR